MSMQKPSGRGSPRAIAAALMASQSEYAQGHAPSGRGGRSILVRWKRRTGVVIQSVGPCTPDTDTLLFRYRMWSGIWSPVRLVLCNRATEWRGGDTVRLDRKLRVNRCVQAT